jgi:hypothetical protein
MVYIAYAYYGARKHLFVNTRFVNMIKKMARRKIFEIRINLPLSQELITRIDAVLGSEEYRTGLIREALRRELERREKAKPRRKGGKA